MDELVKLIKILIEKTLHGIGIGLFFCE